MPKTSSISDLLSTIEATGLALGEKATAVSNLISQVNRRLLEMDGKVSARVESDGITLEFVRQQNWGIWIQDAESPYADYEREFQELATVSVVRKARALPLLLDLLEAIQAEQRCQLEEIDKVLPLAAQTAAAPRRDDKKEGR